MNLFRNITKNLSSPLFGGAMGKTFLAAAAGNVRRTCLLGRPSADIHSGNEEVFVRFPVVSLLLNHRLMDEMSPAFVGGVGYVDLSGRLSLAEPWAVGGFGVSVNGFLIEP